MNRKELMAAIALAAGVSLTATPTLAHHKDGHGERAAERSNSQGFERSGNPRAAGGPENPGKGNPHNAY